MRLLTKRAILEQLVGKTIAEVSHTDQDEAVVQDRLFTHLLTEDGYVFRAGPYGFQVFRPGEYEG